MHINGLGTVRSCSIAVKLIKTVAERGESAQLLGQAHRLYLKGRVDHALLLYARLAEEGFEVAQSNSAWLLDQGQGHNTLFLPTNTTSDVILNISTIARYSLAYRHFMHSAEQGNIDAYRVMGDYAYYGYLSIADYKKAARFYTLAADGRQAQAMFNLGYMHQHGIGVPQDFHLAKRYYDSALEHAAEAYVPVQLALLHLRLSNKLQDFYRWWSGTPNQPTNEGGPSKDIPQTPSISVPTDSQQPASDIVPSFFRTFNLPELPYSLEDIILLVLCLSLAVIVYIRAR
jgi:SEL1 protein